MKKELIVIAVIAAATAACVIYALARSSGPDTGRPGVIEETREITLYYYNPEIDKDAAGKVMCTRGGLVAVSRKIPLTDAPVRDAVKLLIEGNLTENEKKAGLASEFPLPGLALKSANLENGALVLEFDDPQSATSGGNCRADALWFQIEATAKQFEGINEVRHIPESLFQG